MEGISVEFVAVKGKGKSPLGLQASEQMRLISIVRLFNLENHRRAKHHLQRNLFYEFRGEGKLGDLHVEIDSNVPPVQLVPIVIKEKLKEELDRLEGLIIITQVNVPTSWISATVVTLKKNGNVQLCVDPKPLNQALKCNHYPLPTIKKSFLSSQMQDALLC